MTRNGDASLMKKMTGSEAIIGIVSSIVCCAALMCPQVHALEAGQSSTGAIRIPTAVFMQRTISVAFPDDFATQYRSYFLVRCNPTAGAAWQIVVGQRADREQIEVLFREARLPFQRAFDAGVNAGVNNEEKVAELMRVQERSATVSEEILSEWISRYWSSLKSAVPKMQELEAGNHLLMGGNRYYIEVYAKQNRVMLDIVGSEEGNTELDIRALLEWVTSIRDYVKDLPLESKSPASSMVR